MMLYLQLFWEFFKTGLFAVGGGLATLPFLQDMADRTGWFTRAQLADMLAVSESTPGPIGVNMATYVGFSTGGVGGALIATLGLITPSVIVILIVAAFLKAFRDSKWVSAAFYGLRPASTALVAAAGSSSRMGGTDKLMEFLDNVPVLMRTLTALQRAAAIDEIVIAAREDALVDISTLCKTYGITKCSKVVRGGESRCHSVLLAALEASPEARLLAVQDGARPLVTPALIDRTVEAAAKCGAAAPAVPVKDTIKTVAEDGAVTGTPDRSTLRAVQTPQVFEADLLKAALQSALENEVPVTDDCSAVERLGKVVYLIDGDEENLKITTPVDLVIAEAILAEREGR